MHILSTNMGPTTPKATDAAEPKDHHRAVSAIAEVRREYVQQRSENIAKQQRKETSTWSAIEPHLDSEPVTNLPQLDTACWSSGHYLQPHTSEGPGFGFSGNTPPLGQPYFHPYLAEGHSYTFTSVEASDTMIDTQSDTLADLLGYTVPYAETPSGLILSASHARTGEEDWSDTSRDPPADAESNKLAVQAFQLISL